MAARRKIVAARDALGSIGGSEICAAAGPRRVVPPAGPVAAILDFVIDADLRDERDDFFLAKATGARQNLRLSFL